MAEGAMLVCVFILCLSAIVMIIAIAFANRSAESIGLIAMCASFMGICITMLKNA